MDLSALVKDFGPYATIILFFLWRDWKREEKRDKIIQTQNSEVMTLVKQVVQVVTRYEQISRDLIICINNNTNAIGNSVEYCKRERSKHSTPASLIKFPSAHSRKPHNSDGVDTDFEFTPQELKEQAKVETRIIHKGHSHEA